MCSLGETAGKAGRGVDGMRSAIGNYPGPTTFGGPPCRNWPRERPGFNPKHVGDEFPALPTLPAVVLARQALPVSALLSSSSGGKDLFGDIS